MFSCKYFKEVSMWDEPLYVFIHLNWLFWFSSYFRYDNITRILKSWHRRYVSFAKDAKSLSIIVNSKKPCCIYRLQIFSHLKLYHLWFKMLIDVARERPAWLKLKAFVHAFQSCNPERLIGGAVQEGYIWIKGALSGEDEAHDLHLLIIIGSLNAGEQ